jgi:osmotically-inducible protein OsmY
MTSRPSSITLLLLLTILLPACGKNPHRTHEGELLDDKVLEQRVEAALHRQGRDFQNIHAQAIDGKVTLTGEVPSLDARSYAEQITQSVYGVKTVNDETQISSKAQ